MNAITVQFLVTFLMSIPAFMVAVGNTWTAYTLQQLESDASPIGYKIKSHDGSLIGSIVMVGSFPSIFLALCITDKIGRKRTHILSGLCYILAWSLVSTAKSATQIIIGRFFIGFGTGIHFVNGIVYVRELSQTSIRGNLMSCMPFMYNIGSLISYIEGWTLSYDVINYLNLTVAVVFVLLLLCMKESPVYLLRIGRETDAINALSFYRGSTRRQEVIDEIVYLRSQINVDDYDLKDLKCINEKEKLNQDVGTKNTPEQRRIWNIIRTTKSVQRALVVLIANMVLVNLMGMLAVQAYAGQFFMQAAPSLSPHMCSVLLAVVVSVTSALTVVITDMISRRTLMLVSCVLSSMCVACLGFMLRWSWAPQWGIPLIIIIFSIVYHLGAVNIPFVQIAECLPPEVASFGSAIVMSSMFVANFALLLTFKPAIEVFGLDGVFFIFAIIGLVTSAVVFLFMRETKKVPFEIVQNMFEHGFLYRPHKSL